MTAIAAEPVRPPARNRRHSAFRNLTVTEAKLLAREVVPLLWGAGFVDAEVALTVDGAHEMEVNILTAEVLRAVGRLPEAQRETALLVYAEGYTYAEAATALGVPIGTIMSRLASVRAALARLR